MNLKLAPLLSQLTIQTKDLRTDRFPIGSDFAWAQREFLQAIEYQYNRGKPVRIIVLKARQLGISTATEGVLFWWAFLHPGTSGLVIAHERGPAETIFEKTKLYWDTWPYNPLFKLKYATQRRLTWEGTLSSLRVATAKNVQSGRGSTLHAVHASECAFYDDPETLMLGLNQTIPNKHGTIIVLESTANGIGNWFHDQWISAKAGESDYIPVFFPWFKHPEYSVQTTLCTEMELDADEKQLLRNGATYENLQWRRWALYNLSGGDEELFRQEYPATPHEAFITTGKNVFPIQHLDKCYDPLPGLSGMLVEDNVGNVKFVRERNGPLTIFKRPTQRENRWDRYFVAGDPSMTTHGDPACIQVINRSTNEQVAVWHGRIDPINFAKEMMLVGRYYHNAELCPEAEGGGQATVATLLNMSYPHVWLHRWADKAPGKVSVSYGWSTNYNRKNWAIGRVKYLLFDGSMKIHDELTYEQMRNYSVLGSWEMGPSSRDGHDDAVMALAIGVTASHTEGPFVDRPQRTQVYDIFGLGQPS